MVHPRTPVLIGVGQFTYRGDPLTSAPPLETMQVAVRRAAEDAGLAAQALGGVDLLAVVGFTTDAGGGLDGGSVLVKAGSNIAALADLKGRKVAVIARTTTEAALKRVLDQLRAPATLVAVKDAAAGMDLLAKGAVDGFAGDRVVLGGLKLAAVDGADLQVLAQDFSVEPFALALPRNDPDFRLAVNRALVGLYRSGEIDPIFQRWFGGLGQPGPLLHAMFYLNSYAE